uniref:RING-type domain-containing protein n=1 Tax=Cyanoderma ruficeps TaxID=181631 RepID=A0A8C3QZL9_9PASS
GQRGRRVPTGPEPGRECGICYEAYWGAGGGPQQLPCRHSLCQRCLRRLVCRAASVAFVSCPFCRMVTLLPELAPAVTPDPGSPRGEQQQENGDGAPPDPGQGSSRSVAAPPQPGWMDPVMDQGLPGPGHLGGQGHGQGSAPAWIQPWARRTLGCPTREPPAIRLFNK